MEAFRLVPESSSASEFIYLFESYVVQVSAVFWKMSEKRIALRLSFVC